MNVSGLVQGVLFRAETKKIALQLSLTGQVKNNPDGTVTIVAEGSTKDLLKLRQWCRQGSKAARVEKIEEKWQNEAKGFNSFNIVF